eukprot:COSAG01_NODE_24981_length_759_cov_1.792424_1_plen_105_part_01
MPLLGHNAGGRSDNAASEGGWWYYMMLLRADVARRLALHLVSAVLCGDGYRSRTGLAFGARRWFRERTAVLKSQSDSTHGGHTQAGENCCCLLLPAAACDRSSSL